MENAPPSFSFARASFLWLSLCNSLPGSYLGLKLLTKFKASFDKLQAVLYEVLAC